MGQISMFQISLGQYYKGDCEGCNQPITSVSTASCSTILWRSLLVFHQRRFFTPQQGRLSSGLKKEEEKMGGLKNHLPLPTGPSGRVADVASTRGEIHRRFLSVLRNLGSSIGLLLQKTDEADVFAHQDEWPTWLPHEEKFIEGFSRFYGIWEAPLGFFFRNFVGHTYVAMLKERPVSKAKDKFPVIIFSHGLSAFRSCYSVLSTEMASWGYIVINCEHRDGSAAASLHDTRGSQCDEPTEDLESVMEWIKIDINPRGIRTGYDDYELRFRQLTHRVEEVESTRRLAEQLNQGTLDLLKVTWPENKSCLQYFKDRLDMSKMILAGHSFGGATTMMTLTKQPKHFLAGIVLDGWMFPLKEHREQLTNIDVPCLYINLEQMWTEAMYTILRKAITNDKQEVVMIRGSNHEHQSDAGYIFSNKKIVNFFSKIMLFGSSKVHHDTTMRLNNAMIMKFIWEIFGDAPNQETLDVIPAHEDLIVRGIPESRCKIPAKA
ncbi:unnamed protein product [Cyprideis torosa]|uniref:1-alkyl-2-acetylglycerophosphocholine esterase n=1 Tax=Cyprideis torosa TaxID=163714 RepID=A0A7R8ZRN4_9CRUS|nr:unnamed protein product [Cyprideis torosa]CAG0893599.1 unnamed protein product [Cyprideis torosa]